MRRSWLLLPLLCLAPRPAAAFQELDKVDLSAMKEKAKQGPDAQATAQPLSESFDFQLNETPRPNAPKHANLKEAESDPDLLPNDPAGYCRAKVSMAPYRLGHVDGEADCAKRCAGPPGPGVGNTGSVVFCLVPVIVKFSLDQRVLVSDTYANGSCMETETYRHEIRHWEDNDVIFKTESSSLQEDLLAEAKKIPMATPCNPARVKDDQQKEKYLQFVTDRVSGRMRQAYDSARDQMRKKVSERDTTFNYSQIHDYCAGVPGAVRP